MSEYWVSHKKYFCKYCNIYIADDAPSRNQHEGGLRHKGNVERFVRNLYKTGEKRKQDLEEEKREMARVEKAAHAAFAQDVGSGLVKPGSSQSLPVPKEAEPSKPARSTDPYADYTTAASLGYTDPDEIRLKAEQERRSKEGVAGDWEVVAVEEPSMATEAEEQKPEASTSQAGSGLKRPSETQLDDEDTRQFKLRRKKLGVGLGEIYDPGVFPIKLKKKEEPAAGDVVDGSKGVLVSQSTSSGAGPSSASATVVPQWSSRGWNKPGASDARDATAEAEGSAVVKTIAVGDPVVTHTDSLDASSQPSDSKEKAVGVKIEDPETVKKEEEPSAPQPSISTGGLFKKRKLPAGGAGSRGRRS